MYLILQLLVILAGILTYVYGDSREKRYITDLLPEQEKHAFLETAGRRLVNDVRTKDSRYKSSEEDSEELFLHSAHERQVLDKEATPLRRNVDNNTKDFELKIKNVDKPEMIPDVEDVNHTDFTFRKGIRPKRSKMSKVIPIDSVITNIRRIIPGKMRERGYSTHRDPNEEDSTNKDIQVRGSRSSKTVSDNPKSDKTISNEFTGSSQKIEEGSITKPIDKLELNENGYTVSIFVENKEHRNTVIKNDQVTDPTTSIDDTITTALTTNKRLESSIESTLESSTRQNLANINTTTTQSIAILNNFTKVYKKRHLQANDDAYNETYHSPDKINDKEDKGDKNEDKVNSFDTEKNKTDILNENDFKSTPSGDGNRTNQSDLVLTKHKRSTVNPAVVKKGNESNYTDKLEESINNHKLDNKIPLTTMQHSNNTYPTRETQEKNSDIISLVTQNERGSIISSKGRRVNNESNHETDVKEETYKKHTEANIGNQNSTITNNENIENGQSEKNLHHEIINNVGNSHLDKVTSFRVVEIQENKDLKKSGEGQKSQLSVENTMTDKVNGTQTLRMRPDGNPMNITEEPNFNVSHVEEYLLSGNIKQKLNTKDLNKEETPIANKKKVLGEKSNLRSKDYIKNTLTTTEASNLSISNTKIPPFNYKLFYSQDSSIEKSRNNSALLIKETNGENNEEIDIRPAENDNFDFVNNFKNTLRALGGILVPNNNSFSENSDQYNSLRSQNKSKEYSVYEIPEDQIPFLREVKEKNSKENQQQLHSIAIYNYLPTNAIVNRLGPNVEENNENVHEKNEDIDAGSFRRARKFNNDISQSLDSTERFKSKSYQKDQENLRSKYEDIRNFNYFGKPNVQVKVAPNDNIKVPFNQPLRPVVIKEQPYFNPDDYADVDYYFGRTHKKPAFRSKLGMDLQESDKFMTPHKVEDYLSVRPMMYDDKEFRYIPKLPYRSTHTSKYQSITDPYHHELRYLKPRFKADNNTDFIKNLRNKPMNYNAPSGISMDYYYNVNSGEKVKDINITKKKLRSQKEVHTKPNEMVVNHLSESVYPLIALDYWNAESSEKGNVLIRKHKLRSGNEFYKKPNDVNANNLDRSTQSIVKNTNYNHLRDENRNVDGLKDLIFMIHTDVFPTLDTSDQLTKIRASDEDDEINVFVNVLKDMIEIDNKSLVQFDWLGSTVDVIAALDKLRYLTNDLRNGQSIYPSDLQLLKYVLQLYKSAKINVENSENRLRKIRHKRKKNPLPKSNRKNRKFLNTKGLIYRIWLVRESHGYEVLDEFQEFLDDLESSLYDLYNAIKRISESTEYANQRWYENLRIFLKNAQKNHILEVLIHLFTSRLVVLIEDACNNGLGAAYLQDVEYNNNVVNRTVEELVFVMKLLDAFNNY